MDTKYIAVWLIVLGICVLLAYATWFDIYCGTMSFGQDDNDKFALGIVLMLMVRRLLHGLLDWE